MFIHSVNGKDVLHWSHKEVAKEIMRGQSTVDLIVMTHFRGSWCHAERCQSYLSCSKHHFRVWGWNEGQEICEYRNVCQDYDMYIWSRIKDGKYFIENNIRSKFKCWKCIVMYIKIKKTITMIIGLILCKLWFEPDSFSCVRELRAQDWSGLAR